MSFEEFLTALGMMHDCWISSLRIDHAAGSIEFSIDDIYSNFAGIPQYQGPRAGLIILTGVTDIDTDIEEFSQILKVYEIDSREIATDTHRIDMTFWPYGRFSASYKAVFFPTLL